MRVLRERLRTARLEVRRAILLRRRILGAALAAVAVLAGLRATAAPAPPADSVVVAAHDLPGGAVLRASDLTRVHFADGTAPIGRVSLDSAVGRTLAAPLRRGEPVTDLRLVGTALLEGYDGLVAVPVRIPDPEAVSLLAVGDRINLLSTDPRGGGTEPVALDVPILALPEPSDPGSASLGGVGLSGRLVVLGTTPERAEQVADAAVRGFLSVTLGG